MSEKPIDDQMLVQIGVANITAAVAKDGIGGTKFWCGNSTNDTATVILAFNFPTVTVPIIHSILQKANRKKKRQAMRNYLLRKFLELCSAFPAPDKE